MKTNEKICVIGFIISLTVGLGLFLFSFFNSFIWVSAAMLVWFMFIFVPAIDCCKKKDPFDVGITLFFIGIILGMIGILDVLVFTEGHTFKYGAEIFAGTIVVVLFLLGVLTIKYLIKKLLTKCPRIKGFFSELFSDSWSKFKHFCKFSLFGLFTTICIGSSIFTLWIVYDIVIGFGSLLFKCGSCLCCGIVVWIMFYLWGRISAKMLTWLETEPKKKRKVK